MKRLRRVLWLTAIFLVLSGCSNRSFNSGDRVLVAKYLYDTGLTDPEQFDVVVFKYPKGPVENGVPKNYIKRLLGLPGQILAIFFGNIFTWTPTPGEAPPFSDVDDATINRLDLWEEKYMHVDENPAHDWFNEAGKFEILRKPPQVMLAMRRIVYDHDYPARDMAAWPRWKPFEGSGWTPDQKQGFALAGDKKDKIDWLRYQHLLRPSDGPIVGNRKLKPELITDFMDYNSFVSHPGGDGTPSPNWVGDLMLECQLNVTGTEGEFWLELSKGIYRYQARFQLDSGLCTLSKVEYETEEKDAGNDRDKTLHVKKDAKGHPIVKKATDLGSQSTKVKAPGKYQLRFANFDARLTLWVDRDLPFDNGVAYPPPEVRGKDEKDLSDAALMARRGPTENDLEPASIGSKGAAVQIHGLRLWRDTYYTQSPRGADAFEMGGDSWADPKKWGSLRRLRYRTMYVQPGHYLCLGDNSPSSSDSRDWGLVPQRLLLGRALLVYYPFNRAGPIR